MLSAQAFASGVYFEVVKDGKSQPIGPSEIAAIGETEISTKVITLGDGKHAVRGVLGRALLDYVKAEGDTIEIVALDGYTMDIPVDDLRRYDVVLATSIDGKTLSVRDKGPAWLIYPVSSHKELDDTIYESRSVWQIKTIAVD
jgi:hypothetical protein